MDIKTILDAHHAFVSEIEARITGDTAGAGEIPNVVSAGVVAASRERLDRLTRQREDALDRLDHAIAEERNVLHGLEQHGAVGPTPKRGKGARGSRHTGRSANDGATL